jgi:CxxC-x17-CxxC domain-containing protein
MKNYTGNNRSERAIGFSKRRGNDSGKSSMHQATCSNCGKECEVPFKPTSGKPIFCSSCFERNQNEYPKKFGKERGDRKFKSGDSRKRSFGDRDSVMHNALCDNCGKECEVPFRPTKGKPIYCDKCFGNNKKKDTDQLTKEFGILNKKLDEILEILTPVLSVKNYPEELEEETEEETEKETEKPKPEKKTKKKVVVKKAKKKKV